MQYAMWSYIYLILPSYVYVIILYTLNNISRWYLIIRI